MCIRSRTLLALMSPFVLALAGASVQWATVGLPAASPDVLLAAETAMEPSGFPAWLRITHYVNFLFLILLIRSGLHIFMDQPRFYWNVHCTPNAE